MLSTPLTSLHHLRSFIPRMKVLFRVLETANQPISSLDKMKMFEANVVNFPAALKAIEDYKRITCKLLLVLLML